MWKVILPDKQEHEFPDDIAGDDATLRDALVSFVPEIKNADLKRTTAGGVQTVTVIKKAGTKGRPWIGGGISEGCHGCGSNRRAFVRAACRREFKATVGNHATQDGYVPGDMGIGTHMTIEFNYCLDCGKIGGNFPLPETGLERR
ncbi:MAG: hypothetical protein WBV94_04025 [Blastocatellia bacterium]